MIRRNLVITRAGPKSLHKGWLTPQAGCNFDILVASYVEDYELCTIPGVVQIYVPGSKVAGWAVICNLHSALLDKYDQIALLDDDIETNSESISRCFDIGLQNNLAIWQPSLSWSSYFTYAGTLRNPLLRIRFVNFVEMMCPFFSKVAFMKVRDLFLGRWESGVDLVWCSMLTVRKHQFAIVDEVQVRHTRPVGAVKERNGFNGRTYESDIYDCLNHFKMGWPSLVSEGGLTKSGRVVTRVEIAWLVFPLIMAVLVTPNRRALRLVMDHIRHQWTRRPYFGKNVSEIAASRLHQTLGTSGTAEMRCKAKPAE